MHINPRVVITLLSNTFDSDNAEEIKFVVNEDERKLHDVLVKLIQQHVENAYVDVTEESSLNFNEFDDIELQDMNYEDDHEVDDNVGEIGCAYEQKNVDFKYKEEAVKFWLSGRNKPYSLDTVRNRYRLVNSIKQLRRWKQQVEGGGDKYEKFLKIAEYTLNKFKEAVELKLPVHDIDLKRWALQKNSEVKMPSFKASNWWILEFKRKHNIVSRKITKFVTTTSMKTVNELENECENFREKVRQSILEYGAERVFNSDQSAFNLEIHSGRTLNYKGIKAIQNIAQSISSLTHSYTIQPTISAEGQLLSPLLLVLKETSGDFGPRVKQSLFAAENVIVHASKSGKLSKDLLQMWVREIYLKYTDNSSALLLDSWNGQCQSTVYEVIPKEINVRLLTIPPGTTGKIQPLDVYGFRFWKNFVRKLSDIVVLMDYDVNLHERNNIIKLQSLVHNQLCSTRFKNAFKYSWFKSGYLTEKPQEFDNPVDFCFNITSQPVCNICQDIAVITCGWCKKQMCFKHFFIEYHYCKNYNP